MKYIALLRGINVGTSKRVDMKKLRVLCEGLGYNNVSTYINSGNVIFESSSNKENIYTNLNQSIKTEFGSEIPLIIKTDIEMRIIADAIPSEWQNDTIQKTDVAYLFSDADNADIIEILPIDRQYVDIRYIKGALLINVKREDYNKSRLNKIISHPLYGLMTLRNVNTARYLAG